MWEETSKLTEKELQNAEQTIARLTDYIAIAEGNFVNNNPDASDQELAERAAQAYQQGL